MAAITDILKVFYAPHKVFKQIVQKPSYLGCILVLVVFVAAQTSYFYVRASKIYSEETRPTGLFADEWTENATLWQANDGVEINDNYVDFINGTSLIPGSPDFYGNSSVEFVVNNSAIVQAALANLGGSVDCGVDGFKSLSLRVKMVTPETKPENVTLFLYSLSDSNYFSYDLTEAFSNSTSGIWNNMSVPVGSGDWFRSNAAAKWENITSLKMDFKWSTNASIRLRVDGLFFRGLFKNAIDIYGAQAAILNFALSATTPFLFQWLVLTALMYLIIKGLKGNVVWKPLMVAVGFSLVTLVVYALVLLVTFAASSAVNVPFEYFAGVAGEFEAANQAVIRELEQVNLISSAVALAVNVLWNIGLGVFIVRAVTSVPPTTSVSEEAPPPVAQPFAWTKCLLVSAASVILTLIILAFIGV